MYRRHLQRACRSRALADADRLLPPLPHARSAVVLAGPADAAEAGTVSGALRRRGLRPCLIEVPDAQRHKHLGTVAAVASDLADLAVHKDDLIVGVGGEVVCDLAGFLASTYNRGMPLALVPTTLLGQADAAVGGKASLNLPRGRNLLGTMHQPVAVLADVAAAAGRPAQEYQAGLAEIVKHALISGGDLIDLLQDRATDLTKGDAGTLADAVASSVAVKAAIVSTDERERGDRLHLNYGHTFGHAMEQVAGNSPGRPSPDGAGPDGAGPDDDGSATALGMMAAAYLAGRQGRIDDELIGLHHRLLAAMGLPTSGRFDLTGLQEAWLRDKKYQDGARFVVLNGVGRPQAGVPADEETLAAVLSDLGRPGGARAARG